MAKYECEHCGMGVADMKCAKCGESLEHDHITKDDGTKVAIAKCPSGCGKNQISHVLWPRYELRTQLIIFTK